MKKLILLFFLLGLFSKELFAEETPQLINGYVLFTGGFIPYASVPNSQLDSFASSRKDKWGIGFTTGLQFNDYFATEFGFLYSYLYGINIEVPAAGSVDISLVSYDYKLYFLYQQRIKISELVTIFPSVGLAPTISSRTAKASGLIADSATETDFGLGFKAGARFKIDYFLCGLNLEYTKRFADNADSLALMFEAGVMF